MPQVCTYSTLLSRTQRKRKGRKQARWPGELSHSPNGRGKHHGRVYSQIKWAEFRATYNNLFAIGGEGFVPQPVLSYVKIHGPSYLLTCKDLSIGRLKSTINQSTLGTPPPKCMQFRLVSGQYSILITLFPQVCA